MLQGPVCKLAAGSGCVAHKLMWHIPFMTQNHPLQAGYETQNDKGKMKSSIHIDGSYYKTHQHLHTRSCSVMCPSCIRLSKDTELPSLKTKHGDKCCIPKETHRYQMKMLKIHSEFPGKTDSIVMSVIARLKYSREYIKNVPE